MIVADPMSEFLVNLTPADVEPERFTGRAHRQLLVAHEQARIEYWRGAAMPSESVDPLSWASRQPQTAATYKRNPDRFKQLVEQQRSKA